MRLLWIIHLVAKWLNQWRTALSLITTKSSVCGRWIQFKTDLGVKDKQIDIHITPFDRQHLNDKLFDITNVYCPIAITHSIDKRKAEYFEGHYLVAQELQQLGFAHHRLEANVDEIELMVKLGMIHPEAVTLLFSAKEAIYKVFARFVANGLNFGSETLFVIDKVGVKFALSQQVALPTRNIISDSVMWSGFRAVTCQYRYLEQQ